MNIRKLIVALFFLCIPMVIGIGVVQGAHTPSVKVAEIASSVPRTQGTPLAMRSGVLLQAPLMIPQAQITTCQTFTKTGIIDIPDATGYGVNPGVITSTIRITMTGYLTDVTVHTDLTHPASDNIELDFCEPGRSCLLEYREMYGACTNCGLTFNDSAPIYLSEDSLPYGNTYMPDSSGPYAYPYLSPLNSYARATGTYQLVAKDWMKNDTGYLDGWSMTLCTTSIRPTSTPRATTIPSQTPVPTNTPYAYIGSCYPVENYGTSWSWSDTVPNPPNGYQQIGNGACVHWNYGYTVQYTCSAEAWGQAVATLCTAPIDLGAEVGCPPATTVTEDSGDCYYQTTTRSCSGISGMYSGLGDEFQSFNTQANESTVNDQCGTYLAARVSISVQPRIWTPTPTPTPIWSPTPTRTLTPSVTPCSPVGSWGAWFIW